MCFIAFHEKLLDYNFIDKEELILILINANSCEFYVYLSALLPFCQPCYHRKWTMSALLASWKWPFNREKIWTQTWDYIYAEQRHRISLCMRCRSGIKIRFVLNVILRAYVPVTQWLSGSTQIWEKSFHCYSYNSISYDRNHMKYIYIYIYISLSKNLKVTVISCNGNRVDIYS